MATLRHGEEEGALGWCRPCPRSSRFSAGITTQGVRGSGMAAGIQGKIGGIWGTELTRAEGDG
jgi:hypothetical protein